MHISYVVVYVLRGVTGLKMFFFSFFLLVLIGWLAPSDGDSSFLQQQQSLVIDDVVFFAAWGMGDQEEGRLVGEVGGFSVLHLNFLRRGGRRS